jgi:hypothetical protein
MNATEEPFIPSQGAMNRAPTQSRPSRCYHVARPVFARTRVLTLSGGNRTTGRVCALNHYVKIRQTFSVPWPSEKHEIKIALDSM